MYEIRSLRARRSTWKEMEGVAAEKLSPGKDTSSQRPISGRKSPKSCSDGSRLSGGGIDTDGGVNEGVVVEGVVVEVAGVATSSVEQPAATSARIVTTSEILIEDSMSKPEKHSDAATRAHPCGRLFTNATSHPFHTAGTCRKALEPHW